MVEHLILLIPNTVFGNLLLAVVIAASLYLLSKGADRLVDAAVKTAEDFGVPKLIIGATIVSLGTTSPEAAVSVLAALQGKPGLALGNGVGSLITDQCLILGLAMTFSLLPLNRRFLFRQSILVLASAVVLALFAYLSPDKVIERWMGFSLVGGLLFYLYINYCWAKQAVKNWDENNNNEETHKQSVWPALGAMLIGLVLMLLGSDTLIPAVSLAAVRIGIPQAVIAATLVAFGTSLPELMTALKSIKKGHPELILGNILGADGLNVLFVIGLSASAVPLSVDPVFYRIQAPMMLGVLLLFQFYLLINRNLFRRWQGALLLGCYLLFIYLQFFWWPSVHPMPTP